METEATGTGAYLYCVTPTRDETTLSLPGLDKRPVHIVTFGDLSGVVHSCDAKPYETHDEEKAKEWVLSHQNIVDLAMEKFGVVVPMKFNTIFKGGDDTVRGWLEQEHSMLTGLLERFRGKAEYTIKVSIDSGRLEDLVNSHNEISELEKTLETKSAGTSYLLRRKAEETRRTIRNDEARHIAQTIYSRISGFSDAVIQDGKDQTHDEKPILLKASCLVRDEEVKPLGRLLSKIMKEEDLVVKFSGPWPPYSFAFNELGDVMKK